MNDRSRISGILMVAASAVAALVSAADLAAQCGVQNPYCLDDGVAPCLAQDCGSWGLTYPGEPNPFCDFRQGGNGQNITIYALYVKVAVIAMGWDDCVISSDDTASCNETPQACASREFFEDSNCRVPCISGGDNYQRCRADSASSELCP